MLQVIIVAGGSGSRLQADLNRKDDIPKQFITLGGKPILVHTLERFFSIYPEARFTLVLPETHFSTWEKIKAEQQVKVPHTMVAGGKSRFQSVKNGMSKCSPEGLIAIHDGVRPFLSENWLIPLVELAENKGSAIPCIESTDSLRKVEGNESHLAVNRSLYKRVQTPQIFEAKKLMEAYEQAEDPKFTDDASVWEAKNFPLFLGEGDEKNIKITRGIDLQIASAFLKA